MELCERSLCALTEELNVSLFTELMIENYSSATYVVETKIFIHSSMEEKKKTRVKTVQKEITE